MTLRKNVASQKVPFTLINASTGAALTGATCTVKITLDGATQASATGSVSELSGGQYVYSPSQADTNANSVGILITATSAIPVSFTVFTTAADPSDSVRLGLTALPNAAAEASGGLPTLSAAQASNGTINANVHRWLTSTPNALQSGRVDSYLGAVASGVIAAAAFASGALDAVWSTTTRLLTAGTNIVLAKGTGITGFNDPSAATTASAVRTELTTELGRIDVAVSTRGTGTALDAAGVRTAVGLASANLDTQIGTLATASALSTVSGYIDTEVAAIKAKTDNLPASPAATGDIPSAATVASQVRTELTTELGRIDASISSRLASASYTAPLDAAGVRSAVGLASANLDTQLDTLPTAAETATAVRSELTTELGRIDASVSSRLAAASYTAPLDAAGVRSAVGLASANLDTQIDALPTAAETATSVRSELTTELGRIDVAVSSRGTGTALDAAGVRSAVGLATANLDTQLDALPTASENASAVRTNLTTELGRLDAAVSTRLASASYSAPLDAAGTRSAVGLASANLDTQFDALPTAGEVADAVWDEATTDHTTAGTYGGRVLRASNSNVEVQVTGSSHVAADIHELQDGVITAAKFATDAITAAKVAADVGTEIASAVRTNLTTELGRIDATVSTRASQTSVDTLAGYVDTEVAAIKAKTDALPSDPADQSAVEAAITGLLTTQMTESYNADGIAPTVAQALFAIMQRLTEFSISGTTITVKKLDGSTTAFALELDSATAPTSSTRS